MLLEFKVENYKSFLEEVTFSMVGCLHEPTKPYVEFELSAFGKSER